MKILAIGAHPDDIELGCGGTIALCSSEYEHSAYGLVLSAGEMSGKSENRKKEAMKSAKTLEIKELFFGGLTDTRISEGIQTISVIENVINKIKPDIVLTHSAKERHQDHRNAALATYSAARNIPVILSYETPSNLLDFLPQYFVCINKTIDVKIKALKEYYTQSNKHYLETEAIIGLAKFRGYQAKVKFAEAYEVFRIVKTDGKII